jgi:CheY-like chemotaxis protein
VLEQVVPPARYLFHGLQMAACYVAQMAPSGRIAICAMFQAADEMRRLQRFAYRMAQLRLARPEFGANARRSWEEDPAWQGAREVLERLLATWDWGEAFVALDLVVKPRIDAFFTGTFARASAAAGEPLWTEILASLAQDAVWHREWSEALVAVAADGGASEAAVARWLQHWNELAESAAKGLDALLAAPSAGASRERPMSGLLILLVEDSAADAELAKIRLRGAGEIEHCAIARAALARLADASRPRPSVVLLDLSLPDAHGLVALDRTLRVEPPPVLVMSGDDDPASEHTPRSRAARAASSARARSRRMSSCAPCARRPAREGEP